MGNFIKRITCPNKNSKYYNTDNIFASCGYGMFQNGGNCTTYAWGRWYELLGVKPKLCTSNAENWYVFNDGYTRGITPKLGSIAVWAKGKIGNGNDGAGHVAVVEEIYNDGSILTSNSAWKSSLFYTKKMSQGYHLNGYTFQGFIYPPVEFVDNEEHSFITYTVAKGDTLSKIAEKYGTSYQKIASDNGVQNPNMIYPGQVLKIYTSNLPITYTVAKGDTLSKIAEKYGTTYQKIARDNSIQNPNIIYPGQVLKIYK